MAINEQDAFQVFNAYKANLIPDELKPKAKQMLDDYRSQQVQRMQSVFSDLKTLDAEDGSFITADRFSPGAGDKLRKKEANILWLSNRYNAPETDVRKRYDLYKAEAATEWGQSGLDDESFFSRASQEVGKQKKQIQLIQSAQEAAFLSAVNGGDDVADFSAWQFANPDPESFTGTARSAWEEERKRTLNRLGPDGQGLAARVVRSLRHETGVAREEDAWLNQTVEMLTQLKATDPDKYNLVMAVANAKAQKAEKPEKGIAEGAVEAFGRSSADIIAGIPRMLVTTAGEGSAMLAEAGITTAKNPELLAKRIRARSEIQADLQDLARGVIDPIESRRKGWAKYAEDAVYMFAGSSPIMTAFMLPGGQASLTGMFANESYEDFRRAGWDGPGALSSALAIGRIQAAIERVSESAMAIPGVASWMAKYGAKPGMSFVKTFLARTAARSGIEFGEEFAQQVIGPAAQELGSAIISSIPDRPEGMKFRDVVTEFAAAENSIPLLLSILPLGALSAGISTQNDMVLVATITRDPRLLRAVMSEAEAKKIEQEANPQVRAEMIKKAWQATPTSDIVTRIKALVQDDAKRVEEAKNVLAEAEKTGLIPRIRRDAEGWKVEQNGQMVRVDSREAAVQMAYSSLDDLERQQYESMALVADELLNDKEAMEISGSQQTLKGLVNAKLITPQEAAKRAQLAAQMAGMTQEEAQNASWIVLGKNTIEQINNVRTAVSRIYRGANVITQIHEHAHGRWATALNQGYLTHDDGVQFVRLAEQATGLQFLPVADDAKISPQMLDEAIVEVVSADTVGRRKTDKRFTPGVISRGIAAFIKSQKQQQLGERTAGKMDERGLTRFKAFMSSYREFWGVVLRNARALKKARDEGKIGEDFDTFLEALLGTDTQTRVEAEAIQEVGQMVEEVDNQPFSLAPARTAQDAVDIVESPSFSLFPQQVKSDFFTRPGKFYRVIVGNEAFQDIVDTGEVRTNAGSKVAEGATLAQKMAARTTAFPSFSKDSASMSYAGENPNHYIVVSESPSIKPSTRGRHGRGTTFFPTDEHGNHLKSLPASEAVVYKHIGDGKYERVYVGGRINTVEGPAFSLRATPDKAAPITEMPDGSRLVGPSTFSIRAYHGTPHKVDRFSTSKIGTGEGAQAYGWGLYFAELLDVAIMYRDTVTDAKKERLPKLKEKLAFWQQFITDAPTGSQTQDQWRDDRAKAESEIAKIETQISTLESAGNLYTVELLPDADEFLDWDKPLSEQSEKVTDKIIDGGLGNVLFPAPSGAVMNGQQFYNFFGSDAKAASGKIASLGIPGIRYLDGGSRGAGEGTRNYVIFDENLVKILEENGKPVEGASFSLAPARTAQDAEYLAAVESGDMEKAQRMVDEADVSDGLGQAMDREKESFFNEIKKTLQSGKPFVWRGEWTGGTKAKLLITRSSKPDALFQLTFLDESGPAADETFQSIDDIETSSFLNDIFVSSRPDIPDTAGLFRGYAGRRFVYSLRSRPAGPGAVPQKGFIETRQGGKFGEVVYDRVLTSKELKDFELLPVGNEIGLVPRDESGNVIPLSQRFQPESPDIRFSLAPARTAQDAEYLAAVQAGDMKKAQRMVDEAAKAAGYLPHAPFRDMHTAPSNWRATDEQVKSDGADASLDQVRRGVHNQPPDYFDPKVGPRYYSYNDPAGMESFRAITKKGKNMTVYRAVPISIVGKRLENRDWVSPSKIYAIQHGESRFGEGKYRIIKENVPATELFWDGNDIREWGKDDDQNRYYKNVPNNIKSADPVTRDESGNVIPLSKRFNPESPDIRFSLARATSLVEVADTILASRMKKPEFKEGFYIAARRRLEQLSKTILGAKIAGQRTPQNIEAERIFRLRSRQRELIDQGMAGLTPETMMAYSQGIESLKDHPFIIAMNRQGKLMKRSTAQKLGKLRTDGKGNAGDYDGAPALPPGFYSKGAGIMPFEMAQALYDDGMLSEPLADAFWNELSSVMMSVRTNNAEVKKATDTVREIERNALRQATQEANVWADGQMKLQPSDRDRQLGAIRTLNAILSAFSPAIRGEVVGGNMGFINLAELKTDAARAKEITRVLNKLEDILEREAKKHYTDKIERMLERAQLQGKPGEVKKSDFIVTVQDELNLIQLAVDLDTDEVQTGITAAEAELMTADTPEKADSAMARMHLLETFGALFDEKNTTSAEMEVASDYLEQLMKQGREARRMLDEERRNKVKAYVEAASKDVFNGEIGPDTTQEARMKAAKKSGRTLLKKFFQEGLSYDLVLRYLFGADSKTAQEFGDRFILNSNAFEDTQNERRKRLRDFSRELYKTKLGARINQKLMALDTKQANTGVTYLKGREVVTHKMDLDQAAKVVADPKAFGFTAADAKSISAELDALNTRNADPTQRKVKRLVYEQTVKTGDRVEIPLSQMDALYLSMALRQPGILEQQERYGYDQKTVDELENFLTDEAKAWREWMQEEYDAEYDVANQVYMRLFNTRMPQIKFYAPLLKNHQGNQAALDPLNSGLVAQSANPGSIKSRKARTSSLRIESALDVFWSHFNQMDYWVHMAEYLRDVQSVMLNPTVRDAVVSKHGTEGMQTLNAWITLQLGRGVGKGALVVAGNRMIRNIKSAVSMKALALNLSTTLKTLPSMLYSLGEIHLSKWPAALASGMKHWTRLWNTNIIQRRLDIGGMPELRDLGNSALPMSWVNQGIKMGSYPTMYADGVFTTYSAAMAYGVSFDEAKAQGASDEMAHKHAEERTAIIVSKTAQPENWTQKSLLENDASGAGTLFYLFTSDPRQKAALTFEVFNRLRKGEASLEEASRKFLAYWVLPGMMFQLANAVGRSLFKGDDDEWDVVDFATAALVGQAQGFLLIGSSVEMIVSAAVATAAEAITGEEVKGKPFWNSPKNPLDQAAQEMVKAAQTLNEDDGKAGLEKAWQLGKAASMGMSWMTPAGAIPSTAERVFKDTSNLFYSEED